MPDTRFDPQDATADLARSNSLADLAARIRAEHEATALPPRFLRLLRRLVTEHKQRTGRLPTLNQATRVLKVLDADELFAIAVTPTIGTAWRRAALDRLTRLERPGLRARERRLRAEFGLAPSREGST